MEKIKVLHPERVISKIINPLENFPNNPNYPFLIYKKALIFNKAEPEDVKDFMTKNKWHRPWIDKIFKYHHYHSNTHETLIIFAGQCKLQIGGEEGEIFKIEEGDAIIFPAGVSHKNKNIEASKDFKTVGAYPWDIEYDMKYGKASELVEAKKTIATVGLPETDPIYGKNGPLFNYWK